MQIDQKIDRALVKALQQMLEPKPVKLSAFGMYAFTVTELSRCLKQSHYARVKPELKFAVNVIQGIEVHGKLLEKLALTLAEELNMECEPEAYVDGVIGENILVNGRADVLCRKEKKAVVVEVKATHQPSALNPFAPWHKRQLQYYMALLEHMGYEVSGYLIYLGLDSAERVCCKYIWRADKPDYKAVLNEMRQRAEALMKGGIQERGRWCDWCAYRQDCIYAKLV